MAAAAAAPAAEVALADSFAMAAPEMFVATESFVPAAGTLGELGAMEGMGALGSGLGGAGLFGEFGGSLAGQALGGAPSLGQAVTEGILTGGGGAGTAGINEALITEQQARAMAAANSGMTPVAQQVVNPSVNTPLVQGTAAPTVQGASYLEPAGIVDRFPIQTAANVNPGGYSEMMQGMRPDTYAGGPVPEYFANANAVTPASIDTVQAASAINKPYIPYDPQFGTNVTPAYLPSAMAPPAAAPSGLQAGFQKALDFAKENPLSTASMGYTAYKLLNSGQGSGIPEKEEYKGILSKYKMSPDFKGRYANPADFQYTPRVYAEGGIMQAYAGGGPVEAMSNANALGANTGYPMADVNKGAYATPWQTPISRNVIADTADTGVNPMTGEMRFAYGGKTSSELAMDYYDRMTRRPQVPSDKSDVGIYYDLDPDTRYLDPVTAAQIRQAKVNKRANVQLPGMKRPTPMGQINLAPPGMKAQDGGGMTEAAHGGIMQAKKYAEGGDVEDKKFGELSKGAIPAAPMTDAQREAGEQNAQTLSNIGEGIGEGIKGLLSTPPALVTFLSALADAAGIGINSPQTSLASPTFSVAEGPAEGSQAPGFMQANEAAKMGIAAGPSGGMGNVGIGNGATASGLGTGIGGLGAMGGGLAAGGLSSLGGYAAGGNPRLLKGPGDGMSDNIPATIAGKQPARLADGEFVIPADVVSHLGNGSTDAGAKKLHQMMTNVRKARTGNSKQGKQINPNKFIPT